MKEEFDALFAEHQKLLGELQAIRNVKRTWVGLTDEEFTRIQIETPYTQFMTVSEYALQCQIKHEAKLKEKNT